MYHLWHSNPIKYFLLYLHLFLKIFSSEKMLKLLTTHKFYMEHLVIHCGKLQQLRCQSVATSHLSVGMQLKTTTKAPKQHSLEKQKGKKCNVHVNTKVLIIWQSRPFFFPLKTIFHSFHLIFEFFIFFFQQRPQQHLMLTTSYKL